MEIDHGFSDKGHLEPSAVQADEQWSRLEWRHGWNNLVSFDVPVLPPLRRLDRGRNWCQTSEIRYLANGMVGRPAREAAQALWPLTHPLFLPPFPTAGLSVKERSWVQACSWECVDTGFVSYFFTLGKISFLKSDKFGVRSLVFSFFPNLENLFSLPSCPALSTVHYPVRSCQWAGE